MGELTIATINCQGLSESHKRRDVLNHLHYKKYNICCLQDTHFVPEIENYVRTQWGFDCYFNSFKSNSHGVAILFRNDFAYKILETKTDNSGNMLALKLTINDKPLTLINIYGPNEDNPKFYDKIHNILDTSEDQTYIICGDFNLVLNQELDTFNYKHQNNPKATIKVKDIIEDFSLTDPFREFYPNLKRYTWRKKTPIKQSRLDFFLVSINFMPSIKQCNIELGYRTDHSTVVLSIKLNDFVRGKGIWKMNNSLLKDKVYVETIKTVIKKVKKQYALPVYNLDNIEQISNSNLKFSISDQLFFETLLMEIRGKTISYSSFIKKNTNSSIDLLIKEIDYLEKQDILPNPELLESKINELKN